MTEKQTPDTSDPRGTSSDRTSPDHYTSGSFLSLDEPNTPLSDSSFSQGHSDLEGRAAGAGPDVDVWNPGTATTHPYADASVYAYPSNQQQHRNTSSPSATFRSTQIRRKAEEPGMIDTESSYGRTTGTGEEVSMDSGVSVLDGDRQKSTRGTPLGQQMGRKSSTGMLPSPPAALMGGLGLDFSGEPSSRAALSEAQEFPSAASSDRPGTSEGVSPSRSRGEPQRPAELGRERRRGASDSRTPTLRTVQSERRPLSLFSSAAGGSQRDQARALAMEGQGREANGLSAAGPSTVKPGRLSRLYYNPPDGPSVSGLSAATDKRISSQTQHSDPPGRRLAFGYRAPSHSPGPYTAKGDVNEPRRSVSAMGSYDHFLNRDGHAAGSPRSATAGAKELILPSISASKRLTARQEVPVKREDAARSAGAPQTTVNSFGAAPALRSVSSQILKGRPEVANTGNARIRSPEGESLPRSGDPLNVEKAINTKARTVDTGGGRTTTRLKRQSGHPSSTDADPISPTSPVSPRRADALTDAQIVEMGAIGEQTPASLLPADGSPLSSKNVLTIALAKAQSAVTFDSNNAVPEAVEAYAQAVRLLQEVMQRITPKPGSSKKSNREDERRRLKVIHDTYTERIRLLAMLYDSEGEEPADQGEPADESLEVMPSRSSAIPDGARRFAEQPQVDESTKASRQKDRRPIARGDSSSAKIPTSSEQSQPHTPLANDSQGALASTAQAGLYQAQQQSDTNSSYRSMNPGPSSGALDPRAKLTDPPSIRHPSSEDPPATPYYDANSSPAAGQDSRSPMLTTPDRFAQGHLAPSDAVARGSRPALNGPAGSDSSFTPTGAATEQAMPSPRMSNSPRGDGSSWPASGPHTLTADPMDSRSRSSESVSSQSSQRQRAATVASSSARAAAEDAVRQTLLVHPTTQNGTIRQRRKSPSIGGGINEAKEEDAEGSPRSSDEHFGASAAAMRAELSAQRRRALSQPGNRPELNPTGSYLGTATAQAPPVPRLKNGRSLPGPIVTMTAQSGLAPPNGDANSASGQYRQSYRMPSPGLSSPSPYHAVMERGVSASPEFSTAQATDPSWASPHPASVGGDGLAELFPSGLSSLQALGSASYTLSQITACPRLRVAAPSLLQDFCEPLPPQTQNAALGPYRAIKAMDTSISKGGFVTNKLCVPSSLWQASGLRLTALETKVRLIEIVTNGIDAVEKSGAYLLHNSPGVRQPGLAAVQASAFAKQLEDFEVLLVEVQNGLAKKLGISEYAAGTAGKKGGSSFNVLSSKLTRSIDRFAQQTTSGKNLDSPAAYVDSLQRLFRKAQILEAHLTGLLQSKSSSSTTTSANSSIAVEADTVEAYAALPSEIQRVIEAKLLRASDFFAQVIMKIVARDLHIMVEKSLKKASSGLVE
ncbi:hypothetical protein BCV69DRAFT_300922 [Microstroma glucosiphilum]|uniref:MIT domain-containing protein n=1 Tax=Pseudomicrostroma glucosiphilum TaxID=1684307 RepID=A0A316U017_9BASI|nr:hypothetical protein BCV69DRAFT_300922 [Pseudomicrostroma glucosiphilum]PWN18766.1 hypothetical protein BCV69DRAFT_300922 [Pseudomicrostroma glucosiphilum]